MFTAEGLKDPFHRKALKEQVTERTHLDAGSIFFAGLFLSFLISNLVSCR